MPQKIIPPVSRLSHDAFRYLAEAHPDEAERGIQDAEGTLCRSPMGPFDEDYWRTALECAQYLVDCQGW